MSRRNSISTEIIRRKLQLDHEAAGYSDGDAGRLTDRIIGGSITPGLAISLRGGMDKTADARDCRQTAEAT
jgi:hypothetical protein